MKTYKQLPIPEDTAWDRSTLYGRLHWRIRNFITSCHNLIKWFPTIWNDRDWDSTFILKVLQKKIEFQQKELVNANRHMRIELDNRDMTLALNLLERVKEEYYNLECMDYWDNDMIFEEKLDKLADAVIQIARAEEKLVNLEKDRNLILERMEKIDERLTVVEADNNQNKGMGRFVVPFFTAVVTGLVAFFFGKYK